MFWILTFSYWIHLTTTVIWLGGMALMALVAWPALQQKTLEANQWVTLQQRFIPWANVSLVLLLVTGFVQMTNDPQYNGFLVLDSTWAWAILAKHVAFVAMVAIGAYMQGRLYPAMERTKLLLTQRPRLGAVEQAALERREIRFLRLNLACALVVLFFTAVATAT
jgi:uncharacterized membrane protein